MVLIDSRFQCACLFVVGLQNQLHDVVYLVGVPQEDHDVAIAVRTYIPELFNIITCLQV